MTAATKPIALLCAFLMVFGGLMVVQTTVAAEPADALAAGISKSGGTHVWMTASYADIVNRGWSYVKSKAVYQCGRLGAFGGPWTAAVAIAVCTAGVTKFISWAKTKINGSRAGNHGVWFEFYLRLNSPLRYGTW